MEKYGVLEVHMITKVFPSREQLRCALLLIKCVKGIMHVSAVLPI